VDEFASMSIPASTGWWRWDRLDLGLIAFAPRQEPVDGRRTIQVSANDVPLGAYTIENMSQGDAVFGNAYLELPKTLRDRGGDLLLVFRSAVRVSAQSLGIGNDERTLSFAPTYLKPVAR
jgi:hypothetical protein